MDAVARHTFPRLRACVNQFTPGGILFAAGGSPLTCRLSNALVRFGAPAAAQRMWPDSAAVR
jgi:hypothetical protein